jgi:hypothetical protein
MKLALYAIIPYLGYKRSIRRHFVGSMVDVKDSFGDINVTEPTLV